MVHLDWHKPRLTLLAPKIEGLPDSHCHKSRCLVGLAELPASIGNHTERERLLSHALKLERERGSGIGVADVLQRLCNANRHTGHYDEGVQRAREALEIYERLGDAVEQARCLIQLAWLFRGQEQLDAVGEAASHAINLLPETGEEFWVCDSHHILGNIYRSKGEIEKAVHHFEAALTIASSFDWYSQLFEIHFGLAMLFLGESRLDSADVHAERAKFHAVNDPYSLGRAMILQASIWMRQHEFEEARSEILRAAEIFEKLGSSWWVGNCGVLLGSIQEKQDRLIASGQLGEFPRAMPLSGVLVSNLWSRNRMKTLTTASNLRDATSRYPVLSHCPSQRPSVQLQTTYIPPFIHLLYSYTSSFSLSGCSPLALNVDQLIRCLLHPSPTPCLLHIHVSRRPCRPMLFFQQYYNLQKIPIRLARERWPLRSRMHNAVSGDAKRCLSR